MNFWKRSIWILVIILGFVLLPCRGLSQVRADEEPDLSALLRTYRDWGLPLPPADAKLVAKSAGIARVGGELRGVFDLGFRIDGKPGEAARILVGTEWIAEAREWDPIAPADIDPASVRPDPRKTFFYNASSATAIQLEARGSHALALSLFKQGATSYSEWAAHNMVARDSVTSQPPNLPPRAVLAHVAWAHWAIALTDPNSDRAAVARRMEVLTDAEPILLDDGRKGALLESVKLALRPRHSAPGTVEAMIDDLTEVRGDAAILGRQDELWNDPQYRKLALRGFEAVPALIQHLSDRRITWVVRTGPNMTIPLHLCVGDLASSIIKNLAGTELPVGWLADRERFTFAHEQTAGRWWEAASRVGEEKYLVAHVFPDQPPGHLRGPYPVMLRIIAARYPASLPWVYAEMAAKRESKAKFGPNLGVPGIPDMEIANIAATSALPREEMIALLLRAAAQNTSDLCDASREVLERFPPEEVEKVRATLRKRTAQ